MGVTRKIWVLADAHIGRIDGGKDGGEWMMQVAADVREHLLPIDYAIMLGDMSNRGTEEELAAYVRARTASGVARWFEMPGNHDFKSVRTGLYGRVVGCPRYWSVVDGNLAFFSLGAERGNAAALFIPPVEAWLREQLAAHRDKNVIIAAHSFPYDTVDRSTLPPRCLYPRDAVARFLADHRIDLWLGGHIHSGPRTPHHAVHKDGTTYLNVASVSRVYGTEMCSSFVLAAAAGGRSLVARCRNHETGRFLDQFAVEAPLTYPCELDADGPVFTAFDLDVSDHYSRIEEEQVAGF